MTEPMLFRSCRLHSQLILDLPKLLAKGFDFR